MEARTAAETLPSAARLRARSAGRWRRSQAVQQGGNPGRRSCARRVISLSPLMRPPRRPMSIRPTTSRQPRSRPSRRAFPGPRRRHGANEGADGAAADDLRLDASRASARNTPIWAQPRRAAAEGDADAGVRFMGSWVTKWVLPEDPTSVLISDRVAVRPQAGVGPPT